MFLNAMNLNFHQDRITPKSKYVEQLLTSRRVSKVGKWEKKKYGPVTDVFGNILYAVVKSMEPTLVVETGVGMGVSTVYILSALKSIGQGKLISIDRGEDAGILVEPELKNNWEFLHGDTCDILPTLDVDQFDIFFHDTDHTYKNMMFEFEWAYPRLRKGGLLMAHNTGFCDAFFDFAKEVGEIELIVKSSKSAYCVGAIIKGLDLDDCNGSLFR